MKLSTVTGVLAASFLSLVPAIAVHAQEKGDFEFEGYAAINYYKYNWDTDPQRRANVDVERLALEASYRLTNRIKVEAEVEFEHGGTGASMEFDKFEEFGEYESEIEKGGEVILEKLEVEIGVIPEFNVRLGHFYVPVGLVNSDYEPGDYFTTHRSEAEASILPSVWHETGVGVFGSIGDLSYDAVLVNGLDATGFSSANWIMLGHQTRFEMANAENLAVAARADYRFLPGSKVGVSGYYGNSADNRPKPDLSVPAHVGIAEAHLVYESGPFTARGLVLYGTLQNSAEVSKANRSISNNLNVKRTPVGSAALGWFVEAGYDLLSLFGPAQDTAWTPQLDLFGRYDFYDTMFDTAEGIFDNPRWERQVVTAGANYHLAEGFVLKAQYAHRTLGLATDNIEDTFSAGFGVQF